ncbi:MAG TPA: hypothetical protein VHA52_12830, partial [Candidatus Babeliaceae bacterium]|nr:hypothetical protein [Candidatus Babeliaceae bacterium]
MNPKIFAYLALGVYYNTTWAMNDNPRLVKFLEDNPVYAIVYEKGGTTLPQDEQIIELRHRLTLSALPGSAIPTVIPSLKLFYAALQQHPNQSDLFAALELALKFFAGLDELQKKINKGKVPLPPNVISEYTIAQANYKDIVLELLLVYDLSTSSWGSLVINRLNWNTSVGLFSHYTIPDAQKENFSTLILTIGKKGNNSEIKQILGANP